MALLSEKFLMNVANWIEPHDMLKFAIALGIASCRINQIKHDHMHDCCSANFAILQDWNKKEKSDAIEEFTAALKTIPELKYIYDMIGADELGPYEDNQKVIDLTVTTSNKCITRSKSLSEILPSDVIDLTDEDISSDLPNKDTTAKKPVKRKMADKTQQKAKKKEKVPSEENPKKAQYEVSIPGINEELKDGFFIRAQLLDLEKPYEMANKGYTFLAVFIDQDENPIDARYYGGKHAGMRHYQKLSGDKRWFNITNVGIEGKDKIKGKKDADHHCRIKIKSSSRFEPIEPPRNPLANIENKSDM